MLSAKDAWNRTIRENNNAGNPYRDLKSGRFTDAPFSKKMVSKGVNRDRIDRAKLMEYSASDLKSEVEESKKAWADAEDAYNEGGTSQQKDDMDSAERRHTLAAQEAHRRTLVSKIDRLLAEREVLGESKRFLENEGMYDEASAIRSDIRETDDSISRIDDSIYEIFGPSDI